MWLNVSKLDARIQKLQEIRRIAADPELLALLQEFITAEPRLAESAKPDPVDHAEPTTNSLDAMAYQTKEIPAEPELLETSSGIWGIRRR